MSNIESVLALWREEMMTDSEVIAWADRRITRDMHPSAYLFELSLLGPSVCSKKPSHEFPAARTLTFKERFALRGARLDLGSDEEVVRFIDWVSGECMGQDLNQPEVLFGYRVEEMHVAGDVDPVIAYVRAELPLLLLGLRTQIGDLLNVDT
jgi:hypothetical protein